MSDVELHASATHGAAGTETDPVIETAVGGAHADTMSHNHPTAWRYVQIAIILAVLTGVEVAVYYSRELHFMLTPMLIVLSITKFLLVVLFYMHLKFDNKLFSGLFTLGLVLAGLILTGILAMEWPFFLEAITHL